MRDFMTAFRTLAGGQRRALLMTALEGSLTRRSPAPLASRSARSRAGSRAPAPACAKCSTSKFGDFSLARRRARPATLRGWPDRALGCAPTIIRPFRASRETEHVGAAKFTAAAILFVFSNYGATLGQRASPAAPSARARRSMARSRYQRAAAPWSRCGRAPRRRPRLHAGAPGPSTDVCLAADTVAYFFHSACSFGLGPGARSRTRIGAGVPANGRVGFTDSAKADRGALIDWIEEDAGHDQTQATTASVQLLGVLGLRLFSVFAHLRHVSLAYGHHYQAHQRLVSVSFVDGVGSLVDTIANGFRQQGRHRSAAGRPFGLALLLRAAPRQRLRSGTW